MANKTAKQLARDVLAHQLGVQPRQPAKLSDAARVVIDMMTGMSRPEPGTPEAALAEVRNGRTVEAAPRVVTRDDLVAALADERSQASILVRELVRKAMTEGGE